MERRPGTPSLLRELNDRAALELLLTGGPMTRAQLGEHTGLSKVTASQLLSRLEERGLVDGGRRAGGRARARTPPCTRSCRPAAYVAGLHVEQDEVSAGVADITGQVVAEVSVNPNGTDDPVELVRGAVVAACRSAGVLARVAARVRHRHARRARPADRRPPARGQPARLARGRARRAAQRPGQAGDHRERRQPGRDGRAGGRRRGRASTTSCWSGSASASAWPPCSAGRLHRGVGGAAGEIGYLPVPGVPLPQDVTHPATGAFQSLVGAQALLPLAAAVRLRPVHRRRRP